MDRRNHGAHRNAKLDEHSFGKLKRTFERFRHGVGRARDGRRAVARQAPEHVVAVGLHRLGDGRVRVGGAQFHRLLTLELDRVDRGDHACSGELGSLHCIGTDTTDSDNGDEIAGADLGCVHR